MYFLLQPQPPVLTLQMPPKGHEETEEEPGTSEEPKINEDEFADKIVSR